MVIFTQADAWYKGEFSIANGIIHLQKTKVKSEESHLKEQIKPEGSNGKEQVKYEES